MLKTPKSIVGFAQGQEDSRGVCSGLCVKELGKICSNFGCCFSNLFNRFYSDFDTSHGATMRHQKKFGCYFEVCEVSCSTGMVI